MRSRGVKFGSIHSYNDLGMILSSYDIPPAEPKITYVNVPGADGSLDLTEALGDVTYSNRACTFDFSVLPEIDFESKKTEISNKLNGKVFNITLDKDPNYYYVGRCTVSKHSYSNRVGHITVKAVVKPYKYKQDVTTLTRDDLTANYKTLTLTNDRKKVVPTITITETTTIKFGETEYALSSGTHKLLNIQLVEGANILKAKLTSAASGTITITYQEGAL